MNVESYLERVGVATVPGPDLETLRVLHRAHLQTVPFENLDIRRGRPLALDERSLFEKIVERRRGGICYEQNLLFGAVLRALGFDVELVAAEVGLGDGQWGPAYDHMALRVAVGREHLLADVGFGDSFLEPLFLDRDEQPSAAVAAFAVRRDGPWHVVTRERPDGGSPEPQFRFQAAPCRASDFEAMFAHHQTSPASHFTRKDICSRATENGRITVSGDQLIETIEGVRRVTVLADPAQRRAALQAHFGIVL